ncbi:hypothetical protein EYF80_056834 [Liparis tanakae]|uniref:Uncharacterized protein n=1 Tax=Liparis tanakae TaxID=230148 RepID=A0A4Z2EW12_9TELE|nr:hypothetical protein EYF80_056834 [Liparis tanakae]
MREHERLPVGAGWSPLSGRSTPHYKLETDQRMASLKRRLFDGRTQDNPLAPLSPSGPGSPGEQRVTALVRKRVRPLESPGMRRLCVRLVRCRAPERRSPDTGAVRSLDRVREPRAPGLERHGVTPLTSLSTASGGGLVLPGKLHHLITKWIGGIQYV